MSKFCFYSLHLFVHSIEMRARNRKIFTRIKYNRVIFTYLLAKMCERIDFPINSLLWKHYQSVNSILHTNLGVRFRSNLIFYVLPLFIHVHVDCSRFSFRCLCVCVCVIWFVVILCFLSFLYVVYIFGLQQTVSDACICLNHSTIS